MNRLFKGAWTAYLDDRLTADMVRSRSAELHNMQSTLIVPDPCGHVDFSCIRKEIPEKSCAAAFYEFDSPEEETIHFGLCGDWWYVLYLNGEVVFDCLKESNGSKTSIYARPMQCTLKKGKNIFAVYLLAGSITCSFDIGLLPEKINLPESKLADFLAYFQDPVLELAALPWLTGVHTDSITIRVAVRSLCAAAIRYKPADGGEERILEHAAWGERILSKLHCFDLKGLQAGTRYQYEVLLRWKDSGKQIQKVGPFYFKTLAGDMTDHTLLLTGDTQVSLKDMKKCFNIDSSLGLFQGNDLLIHLGDIQSIYPDFQNVLTTTFLKGIQDFVPELPLMFARGNHEYRGVDALAFADLAGKPYESFVLGEVFYLKLDSGWDADACHKELGWCDVTGDYMHEQKAWLEETVRSGAWEKARYHVVLTHATPCYDFSPFITRNIQMLAGDLFLGENPRKKIDLWLCGHTHLAARFDVENQKYLTAKPCRHFFYFDEEQKYMIQKFERGYAPDYICLPFKYIPFPVAVVEGPDSGDRTFRFSVMRLSVSEKGLHLKHYDSSGNLCDEFTISPDHQFKVLSSKLRSVTEQQSLLK